MKKQNTTKTKQTEYSNESFKRIEEVRSQFVPFYKRSEKIERILFAAGLLIVICSAFLIPSKEGFLSALKLILMIAPLAALIIYALVIKKVINEKSRVFFTTYYKESVNFAFTQKGITKLVTCEPPSIQKEQFDENGMYNGVFQTNSKGYSTFIYHKLPVSVTDVAAYIKKGKKTGIAFTGKYLFAKAKHSGKDKTIVYLKGTGITLPPTNIEGLKTVLDNKEMVIYSNSKDWKKVLTTGIMKKIHAIKTNKLLVDVAISIVGGKQFVCMGYDDPLMVPPFENKFDPKPLEQYKKEVALVLDLMEALS